MEIDRHENEFLEAVLGAHPSMSKLRQGLHAYAACAAQQIDMPRYSQIYAGPQPNIMLRTREHDPHRSLSHAAAVVSAMRSIDGTAFTIDRVIEALPAEVKLAMLEAFDSSSGPITASSDIRRRQHAQYLRSFIFCIVAAASLSFKVTSIPTTQDVQIGVGLRETRTLRPDFGRPLFMLLKSTGAGGRDTASTPTELDVTNLRISSILGIGRMTIIWVDTLDRHLEYDAETRRIGVFRFPSFLLADQLAAQPSFLRWLDGRMYGETQQTHVPGSVASSSHLSAEVLLSLRLLFGQDKTSRTLYRSRLKEQAEAGYFDPLLDQLCGRSDAELRQQWPELAPVLGNRSSFISSAVYPRLGERMGKIQADVKKSRPKKFADLYRDRRDQEKYHTFRAVIIFGTAAIVLGVIQVLLSAAQLALAYYQWQASLSGPGS